MRIRPHSGLIGRRGVYVAYGATGNHNYLSNP